MSSDDALIIQIGAHDEHAGDPLQQLLKKHDKWRAIFVEPVPHVFERLQRHYGQ